MLNQVIIVGRLVQDPKTKELENKEKSCVATLAIPRSYKNNEGIYETDFVPVILYKGIAENTSLYCKKGDMIGVKGRIQTRTEENKTIIEIIADKVSFLSSNLRKEENGE